MVAEFSYNRLGHLPTYPTQAVPFRQASPRVTAAPAGYVWFFDLLTKELHQTKMTDWEISLVVIGLERLIPPDTYINAEIQAKACVEAKLKALKEAHPDSDALVAVCDGLLALLAKVPVDA